jgi:tetratricopeptide (TPR) repeat protein
MGVVYRAHDEQLERDVAIKVLPAGLLSDEAARRRFRKEALALAKLNHPNIATVHEFGSQDGLDFLVTEYIPGITLDQTLKKSGLPLKEAVRLGSQLALGLEAAHEQGVVHRDLKPGNLRITPDGRLKILDFGLAQLVPKGGEASLATLTDSHGLLMGTLPYMAPEQLRGGMPDARSDLWAAGAVLYEMATGQRAFPERSTPMLSDAILNREPQAPSKVNRRISPGLENIIVKTLAKEPEHRYQTAKELHVDLERLTAGIVPQASAGPGSARWPLLLAAGIVLALLAAGGIYWQRKKEHIKAPAAVSTLRGRPSVAVLGFKNLAGRADLAWLSTAISEMLTTELAAGEQLRTVSGENVALMKASLAPPETESYSKETLAKIRQILGTDEIVMGSYMPVGEGQIRLDLRLQDTTAGETVAAVSAKGPEAHLDELVSEVGTQLRAKLGVEKVSETQTAAVRASLPGNPEAARLYAEGLAKLRVFEGKAARDLLEKALQLEPKFALSHAAMAMAWASLGYDAKANAEARKAFELSEGLSREERLSIEARYRENNGEKDKAIELYRTLFNFFPDNLDYGLRLATAQTTAGKGADAQETIQQLRKFAAPQRDDPRIDLAEAMASRSLGDYQGMQAAAGRAIVKAKAQDSGLLVARGRTLECVATRNLGDPKGAVARCEEAVRTYSAAGDLGGAATATNNLANCYYDQGDLPGAKKTYQQSLATYRHIGNQAGTAGALDNIANVLADMGKPAEAKALSVEALKIFREVGDPTGEGETLNNIAAQEVTQGNLAEARKTFEQALQIWKKLGDTNGMGIALTNVGEMLLDQGDLALAQEKYQESLKIFEETGQKDKRSYPLIGLGDLFLAQGKLQEAKRNFSEVVEFSRASGDKHQWSASLVGLGEVLMQSGDLAGAKEKFEEALQIRKEVGEKSTTAESEMALAKLALQEKKFAQAETLLRPALAEFQTENLREDDILARCLMARILLEQGKVGEARAHIDAASATAAKTLMTAVQLEFATAAARVKAASGNFPEATRGLAAALDLARKQGYVLQEYEIRWEQAELELKAGRVTSGKLWMDNLRKDARGKGFGLIAERAGG